MRYIKAKKPISANHKKLGELSVDGVEVPQYDSYEEFVQAVKGTSNALDYINGQVATGAKNVGRAMLRNAEDTADKEKLYASASEAVRTYVPSADTGGVSVKNKAEQRDKLKAALESGESLTREQLLAMLD